MQKSGSLRKLQSGTAVVLVDVDVLVDDIVVVVVLVLVLRLVVEVEVEVDVDEEVDVLVVDTVVVIHRPQVAGHLLVKYLFPQIS